MRSLSQRWVLTVLLLVCLVAVVAGAAWAGPASSDLADDPPAGVVYETIDIAPSVDSYLYAWGPTRNFVGSGTLNLRSSDTSSPMFQFDLAEVPDSPYVTIATGVLHVYVQSRTNPTDISFATCQVLSPWVGDEVTWFNASAGTAWQTPGCNGAQDRAGAIGAPMTLTEAGMWVEIDITEVVRAWYAGEADNYGVILKSLPGNSVNYEIASSESREDAWRPFLEVTYGLLPTPQPTLPPSPTPTPLPLLDVTKTGPVGPLEVTGDEVIDYTIVVANHRNVDFTQVMITDSLPLGTEFLHGSVGAVYDEGLERVRWAVPELASGESVTLSLSLGVPSWVKADGNVVNVVRAGCGNCYAETEDYWEIPVNIVNTPTPTATPYYDLWLPLVNKQSTPTEH